MQQTWPAPKTPCQLTLQPPSWLVIESALGPVTTTSADGESGNVLFWLRSSVIDSCAASSVLSRPAVTAALAAWDDREHVRMSVEMNRKERDFLYREFENRGVKYVPSFANFVLVDLGRPARPVTAALLKEGVIVRPAWGCPTCMRVSVGTHPQNERFLAALEKVL